MHIQKIKNWLLKPQNDMRPISWIIGFLLISAIIFTVMLAPPYYLTTYSGTLPTNILMGILAAGSIIVMAALLFFGWLIFEAIDIVFDICYLIKRHRSQ